MTTQTPLTAVVLFALCALCTLPARAADLVIQDQTIAGTQLYDSSEGIIFEHVVMTPSPTEPTAVTAYAAYEVVLKPGTRIEKGARFTARMKDADGLPNRWEIQYFGNLNQDPDGDFDGDGLTNLQEYINGTDPTVASDDHDGDGLPDAWELQYGNLSSITGRNDDNDGDGISNWVEYKLGTNPLEANAKAPGIYYQYDKLGRMKKIERIPSR